MLNDDGGDESHKELQLIYLFKQSQFEITQSDTNIIEQICFIIKQKLNEKIEASLINSMLNMMMIIVSLSSISQEKKNEIIASSTNNITMLPHMSLLFYKFMQSSKIINENAPIDKCILISGDSQILPLIPILAYYVKTVIYLDYRWSGITNTYLWEHENITDVVFAMFPLFHSIDKYADHNLF